MTKLADTEKNDRAERVTFQANLTSGVRSMLSDYSKVRRQQAEDARKERQSLLLEIRNQVSDLRQATAKAKDELCKHKGQATVKPVVAAAAPKVAAVVKPVVAAAPKATATVKPVVAAAAPKATVAVKPVIAAAAPKVAAAEKPAAAAPKVKAAKKIVGAAAPKRKQSIDWLREAVVMPAPKKVKAGKKR